MGMSMIEARQLNFIGANRQLGRARRQCLRPVTPSTKTVPGVCMNRRYGASADFALLFPLKASMKRLVINRVAVDFL